MDYDLNWPLLRIKVEYGSDGSLESRLYLSGAGSEDSGQYSCLMPGMEAVTPANINISITTGENNRNMDQVSTS